MSHIDQQTFLAAINWREFREGTDKLTGHFRDTFHRTRPRDSTLNWYAVGCVGGGKACVVARRLGEWVNVSVVSAIPSRRALRRTPRNKTLVSGKRKGNKNSTLKSWNSTRSTLRLKNNKKNASSNFNNAVARFLVASERWSACSFRRFLPFRLFSEVKILWLCAVRVSNTILNDNNTRGD